MTQNQNHNGGPFRPGDEVEVNIAGLRPVTMTEVLVDLESHENWHPAVVADVLPNDMYVVEVMPLIGAIEVPLVHVSRLRRRLRRVASPVPLVIRDAEHCAVHAQRALTLRIRRPA